VPPAQTAADRAGSRASEIGTLKILFCNWLLGLDEVWVGELRMMEK
jgi:hypothetical protein